MAVAKRKPKIEASEVGVGNRSLEAVLLDLAERSARAEERSARAEEGSRIALETIAALLRDFQTFIQRMDARVGELEKTGRA